MEKNNFSPILLVTKTKSRSVFVMIFLVIVLAVLVGFYLGKYTSRTIQKSTQDELKQNNLTTQSNRDPIVSPSGAKKVSFKDGKTMLFDGSRNWIIEEYTNIQDFTRPEILWSPDESVVTVKYGLTNKVNSMYRMPGRGDVIFASLGSLFVFWSDEDTAYIGYQPRFPGYRISKFAFGKDKYYPEETVIYEDLNYNNNGSPLIPAAISPDGKYLILEVGGEWATILSVFNTVTQKVKSLGHLEEDYVISSKPNYRWSGSTITFKGVLTQDGSVNFLRKSTGELDETLFKDVSINLSSF